MQVQGFLTEITRYSSERLNSGKTLSFLEFINSINLFRFSCSIITLSGTFTLSAFSYILYAPHTSCAKIEPSCDGSINLGLPEKLKIKKTLKFMVPFYGWTSPAARLQTYNEETIYFLPLSSQKFFLKDR